MKSIGRRTTDVKEDLGGQMKRRILARADGVFCNPASGIGALRHGSATASPGASGEFLSCAAHRAAVAPILVIHDR